MRPRGESWRSFRAAAAVLFSVFVPHPGSHQVGRRTKSATGARKKSETFASSTKMKDSYLTFAMSVYRQPRSARRAGTDSSRPQRRLMVAMKRFSTSVPRAQDAQVRQDRRRRPTANYHPHGGRGPCNQTLAPPGAGLHPPLPAGGTARGNFGSIDGGPAGRGRGTPKARMSAVGRGDALRPRIRHRGTMCPTTTAPARSRPVLPGKFPQTCSANGSSGNCGGHGPPIFRPHKRGRGPATAIIKCIDEPDCLDQRP